VQFASPSRRKTTGVEFSRIRGDSVCARLRGRDYLKKVTMVRDIKQAGMQNQVDIVGLILGQVRTSHKKCIERDTRLESEWGGNLGCGRPGGNA